MPRNFDMNAVPSGLGEFGLVKDVQELVRLHRVQIEAIAPDELQGVPRFRVVTRCNRDSTFRLKLANGYLKARSWAHPQINYLATGGEKAGHDSRKNHWTRGSCVT